MSLAKPMTIVVFHLIRGLCGQSSGLLPFVPSYPPSLVSPKVLSLTPPVTHSCPVIGFGFQG